MTSRIAFMVSGLLAKHEGVQAERTRITRDLHDDVAARLLSLVHRVQDPAVQTQARDALGALRHIIYALDDKTPLPLPDLLNELQAQMRERARLHGIEVVWQEPGTLPDVQFGARENINLQRILAEAMSNAIRHCAPARFTVQLWIEAQDLHMHFCNDGAILQTEDWVAGKGTNNIRSRMNEIGGTARWNTTAPATETGNQKCCLELRIPLPAATPP
jgi:signal transduction histidine kinase